MTNRFRGIVAFCKGFGIGKDNALPWKRSIPEDLKRFKDLTKGHIVVMGKDTYFSLPEQHRPLKDRLNIVLTSTPCLYQQVCNTATTTTTNVVFMQEEELMPFLSSEALASSIVFFMGGQKIYEKYIDRCDTVYVTYVDKEFSCDRFFPFHKMSNYYVDDASTCTSSSSEVTCTFFTFRKKESSVCQHADVVYGSLLKDIIANGDSRDDRTGTGTVSVFGRQLRFDISKSVPLLTTKHVPYKSVIKELLWFLKGDTNANHLKEQGVNIWNANSTREFLDGRNLFEYQEGDIGPMYGFQWRHFGAPYHGCDSDYSGHGVDQLQNVVNLLRHDPFSRRILMTTVNVNDLEKGCLHPCHGIVVQFYVSVEGNEKRLSCHMYQRSVDTFLGLTWNIFSYAVLTYILAKMTGMKPKELVISTGDTHLYKDHIEQAHMQLTRQPYPLPKFVVKDRVQSSSFEDLTMDDFELQGYFYHPAIKANMSV
jgi:thymidylate synthase